MPHRSPSPRFIRTYLIQPRCRRPTTALFHRLLITYKYRLECLRRRWSEPPPNSDRTEIFFSHFLHLIQVLAHHSCPPSFSEERRCWLESSITSLHHRDIRSSSSSSTAAPKFSLLGNVPSSSSSRSRPRQNDTVRVFLLRLTFPVLIYVNNIIINGQTEYEIVKFVHAPNCHNYDKMTCRTSILIPFVWTNVDTLISPRHQIFLGTSKGSNSN